MIKIKPWFCKKFGHKWFTSPLLDFAQPSGLFGDKHRYCSRCGAKELTYSPLNEILENL